LRYSLQKVAEGRTFYQDGDSVATKAKTDDAFSPRVGLVYQPTPTTSLFASYSNNFVTNSGTDIYLNNLKPSIIDQYEMGIKNDLIEGKLTANFTVYRIINNDLAMNAPFDKDGNPISNSAFKQFAGETTSDGAELDVSGTILPGLNFLAGYSYNFMRFTKTSGEPNSYIVGERLVSNPAHTGNASIFYTVQNSALKGLKLGASAFYTGKRNGGWNNQVGQKEQYSRLIPVSSFMTFDVSAGYTYKQFSILGIISNLTNELSYYVHENYSVNPIPPRMFTTTVSFKF
jgi:iron complex outermembrane receptor protein